MKRVTSNPLELTETEGASAKHWGGHFDKTKRPQLYVVNSKTYSLNDSPSPVTVRKRGGKRVSGREPPFNASRHSGMHPSRGERRRKIHMLMIPFERALQKSPLTFKGALHTGSD